VSTKTSILGRIIALMASRVRQVAQSILRSVESSIPYSTPKFIAVGVLGVVGFPLYYFASSVELVGRFSLTGGFLLIEESI